MRALLHAGRIEGIILLGANLCGRNLPAMDFAREWVARHGEEQITMPRI